MLCFQVCTDRPRTKWQRTSNETFIIVCSSSQKTICERIGNSLILWTLRSSWIFHGGARVTKVNEIRLKSVPKEEEVDVLKEATKLNLTIQVLGDVAVLRC